MNLLLKNKVIGVKLILNKIMILAIIMNLFY